ncbi:MAG: helix-turn-helix domain-containing protein [Desulfitobacterium sp.]
MAFAKIDRDSMMKLYMAGYTDNEVAKALGCTLQCIYLWRTMEDLPANGSLFAWQKKLIPSEFAKIPPRYRHPKMRELCG